ncbi:cellulose binding domain-containing protein [Actinoplanes sp. NPDC048967]|uniref:cellulose binding domain-containing protein n=1 Tax=Actinoplanes sp. NPDC048967 TaxID=3155269 RepID=UPI0034096CAF
MPGKHNTVIPLRRYTFIAGAATLLVVLVSWVAIRAVGPAEADGRVPLMVQPTVPLGGAEVSVPPTSVPPPSAVPTSASPSSASPKPVRSSPRASRSPSKKPAPRRTTPPAAPPAASFTAAYGTGRSWDRGFIAGVQITNKSGPARTWTVKVSYNPDAGVRVGNTWNAQLSRDGNTFVFTGGPLAPGATAMLGFEASKQVRGRIQPTSCTVDGAPCRLG